jgi:hypothetical protein
VFWVVNETPGIADGHRPLLGDGSEYHFYGGAGHRIWDSSHTHSSIQSGQTRVNGVSVNGTTSNRPTSLSIVSLTTTGPVTASSFANDRNVGAQIWSGNLAELIVYDAPLTSQDRQAVERYLGARYGITVP